MGKAIWELRDDSNGSLWILSPWFKKKKKKKGKENNRWSNK